MNGLCTLLLTLSMIEPSQPAPIERLPTRPAIINSEQLPQYTIVKTQNEDYKYLVYEIPKEEPKTYDI